MGMADIEEVKRAVNKALNSGIGSDNIIGVLSRALEEVGEKYEKGDFFLSELMMAGHLANEVTGMLKPHLKKVDRSLGKVIIGTVKGDIHDIGKNIVIMMLQAAGFEVIDLGIDVSTEKFLDSIKNDNVLVLGMSALLASTVDEMKTVVDALKEKGLRDKIKVIVGGRPVATQFAEEIGADAYAGDAVEAVKVVKRMLEMD
jgi:methylmalonyl-CoA mutase cobalamin-binding domain/chain